MQEKKSNQGEFKYFKKIPSSEITLQEEDIFYRPKYNEIINYFKYLLTIKKNELEEGPNGLLLITCPHGTDILEYLKLISKNYYLDFFHLNYNKILKEEKKFPQKLSNALKEINNKEKIQKEEQQGTEDQEAETEKEKSEERQEKKKRIKLLIIDESAWANKRKVKKPLLEYLTNQTENLDLLKKKTILVWLNYDNRSIFKTGGELFQFFDLYLKIPHLTDSEREVILNTYLEDNEMLHIEIEQVLEYMDGWEVRDIKNILKMAKLKYQINSDISDESGDLTSLIIDLITSGEFFPISMKTRKNISYSEEKRIRSSGKNISDRQRQKSNKKEENEEGIKSYISSIKEQKHSEFMVNQLYENAASKNYDDLLLIIERIKNEEPLGENSRKILGKFPFILNDPPKQALIKLEKAKKRIDHIKNLYKE